MLQIYDLIREPTGPLWKDLLNNLRKFTHVITFVLRDELGLNKDGRAFLERLRPHILSEQRKTAWPGTVLLNGEATVYEVAFNEEVLRETISASLKLYGWRQPILPEDIAFLRKDQSILFASITHERDAYMELTHDEFLNLSRSVSGFAAIVKLRGRN